MFGAAGSAPIPKNTKNVGFILIPFVRQIFHPLTGLAESHDSATRKFGGNWSRRLKEMFMYFFKFICKKYGIFPNQKKQCSSNLPRYFKPKHLKIKLLKLTKSMFDKFAAFFRNCGKKIVVINRMFPLIFKIT